MRGGEDKQWFEKREMCGVFLFSLKS